MVEKNWMIASDCLDFAPAKVVWQREIGFGWRIVERRADSSTLPGREGKSVRQQESEMPATTIQQSMGEFLVVGSGNVNLQPA